MIALPCLLSKTPLVIAMKPHKMICAVLLYGNIMKGNTAQRASGDFARHLPHNLCAVLPKAL
jgi:hypothetical protein